MSYVLARLGGAASEPLQERGFRRLFGPASEEGVAIAPRATLLLPVPEPLVARRLVVDVQPQDAGRGKELEVALDGQVLGRARLDGPRRVLAFDVPAALQRGPRQRLRLLFPEEDAARGSRRAGPPAARLFHVALAPAADAATRALELRGAPVLVRDGVIHQAAPSRLRFALLRPPRAALQVLPALTADAPAGSAVTGRVLVRDGAGEREVWSGRLAAGDRPREVQVDLPGAAGEAFELVFVAEHPASAEAPFLAWGAPRVVAETATDPLQHEPVPPPAPVPTVDGVLFVVFDAARARQFGAYGYGRPTTPEVDRIAREGIVFEQHIAPAVTTGPSMSSVWTSRYPDSGLRDWLEEGRMPRDRLTLAELLAANGVDTAAFVANPGAGPSFGLERGFARFERLYREPWHSGTPPGADIFRKAVYPWIGKAPPRFLLYTHWREPHTPYGPVLDGPAGPLPEDALNGAWWTGVNEGRRTLTPAEHDHLVRLYDGNLRWADAELGLLRRELEKAGLWDRMAVIVTGDHGEALLEHGYYGHNVQLFHELVHVPMVVRLPSSFGLAGKRVPALTSHLDIAPTIAHVLGTLGKGGSGTSFRGRSLVDVARTGKGVRGVVSRTIKERPAYAVTTPRYKLIHDVPTGDERLFDLLADPLEKMDVAASQPLVRAALRQSLFRWLLDMRAAEGGGDVEPAAVDEKDREALRALGYVQ